MKVNVNVYGDVYVSISESNDVPKEPQNDPKEDHAEKYHDCETEENPFKTEALEDVAQHKVPKRKFKAIMAYKDEQCVFGEKFRNAAIAARHYGVDYNQMSYYARKYNIPKFKAIELMVGKKAFESFPDESFENCQGDKLFVFGKGFKSAVAATRYFGISYVSMQNLIARYKVSASDAIEFLIAIKARDEGIPQKEILAKETTAHTVFGKKFKSIAAAARHYGVDYAQMYRYAQKNNIPKEKAIEFLAQHKLPIKEVSGKGNGSYRKRNIWTEEEKNEVLSLHKKGVSSEEIASKLGKTRRQVMVILKRNIPSKYSSEEIAKIVKLHKGRLDSEQERMRLAVDLEAPITQINYWCKKTGAADIYVSKEKEVREFAEKGYSRKEISKLTGLSLEAVVRITSGKPRTFNVRDESNTSLLYISSIILYK